MSETINTQEEARNRERGELLVEQTLTQPPEVWTEDEVKEVGVMLAAVQAKFAQKRSPIVVLGLSDCGGTVAVHSAVLLSPAMHELLESAGPHGEAAYLFTRHLSQIAAMRDEKAEG